MNSNRLLRSNGGIIFESKLSRSGIDISDDVLVFGSFRCGGVPLNFVALLSVLDFVLTFSFDSLLSSGRGIWVTFDLISGVKKNAFEMCRNNIELSSLTIRHI